MAQYGLGVYYDGIGDDKTAVEWFTKSAEQGYASAQFALGLAYYYGKGVDPDPEQATFWLKKAAEQDHADAKEMLGL